MYCPNCGSSNSEVQRFCRKCGLGLEKVAQSLAEQLPTKAEMSLQERKERLERLGMGALSVFGISILGFILYQVFYKLMLTQGTIIAGLGVLAAIVIVGCGLLSVVLFAKANELKEAAAKRHINDVSELTESEPTGKLLEAHDQPEFSIAEGTTELLPIDRVRKD